MRCQIKDDKIIVHILTTKSIDIIKNDKTIFTLDILYTPMIIGINTDSSLIAIGSEVSLFI